MERSDPQVRKGPLVRKVIKACKVRPDHRAFREQSGLPDPPARMERSDRQARRGRKVLSDRQVLKGCKAR